MGERTGAERENMAKRKVEIKLDVMDIVRCGYHTHRGVDPEVCAREHLFPTAERWVDERRVLRATNTGLVQWDPDNPVELDGEPLLCRATAHGAGDHLFAMYQVVSAGAAVSSLSLDAAVNGAEPELVKTGPNRVTGVSRYFWAMPGEGVLCAIRFGRSGTSRAAFDRWCRDFLQIHAPGLVERQWAPDGDLSLFVRQDQGDPRKVWARFKTLPVPDQAALNRVRSAPSSVKAVLYRGRFPTPQVRQQANGLFGRFMRFIPTRLFQDGGPIVANVRMRHETAGLSLDVVNKLIDLVRSDPGGRDIGFQLPSGQVWVGRPKPLKREVEVGFSGGSDEQVDVGSLLATLQERFRSSVLTTIRRHRESEEEANANGE